MLRSLLGLIEGCGHCVEMAYSLSFKLPLYLPHKAESEWQSRQLIKMADTGTTVGM